MDGLYQDLGVGDGSYIITAGCRTSDICWWWIHLFWDVLYAIDTEEQSVTEYRLQVGTHQGESY